MTGQVLIVDSVRSILLNYRRGVGDERCIEVADEHRQGPFDPRGASLGGKSLSGAFCSF